MRGEGTLRGRHRGGSLDWGGRGSRRGQPEGRGALEMGGRGSLRGEGAG